MLSIPTIRNVFLSPAFIAALLVGAGGGGKDGGGFGPPKPPRPPKPPQTDSTTQDFTTGKCSAKAVPPPNGAESFNVFRASKGLPSVKAPTVPGVQKAATFISQANAINNSLGLTDIFGNPLPAVLNNNGITSYTRAYGVAVASCAPDIDALLVELQGNSTIKAVMSDPRWTDVGISLSLGSDTVNYKNYWVLVFVQNPSGPGTQGGGNGGGQQP
jgi:hypothetical protein